MPSGGARARSGPPADPNALRRSRDAADWTTLPDSGRGLPAPDWPLPTCSDRELELWTKLWAKPQALMWEQQGQEDLVALYCRRFAEAEMPDSSVGRGTLVRQMADSLGLTTPGIRANRWKVESTPDTGQGSSLPDRTSARDRMRVVPSGDGA